MQTKLSICSSSLKMNLQQLVVIVSIATITQQISTTAAFPLAPRLPGDNLPTNEATVSKEDVQADKNVHKVERSEPIDTETVTAAQLIYRTYESKLLKTYMYANVQTNTHTLLQICSQNCRSGYLRWTW